MIADGDILNISYTKNVMPRSDYYIHFAVIPYENTFDLAVNTFKSQQGDIKDIDYSSTVNIAGTLSDDTEFSYNAVKK